MSVTPYILSTVMLEEHRQNVTRNIPDPDWPAPVRVEPAASFSGLRQRVSDVLRSIADRLEPAGTRAPRVHLVVMPYPGDAGKTGYSLSARKES